jgi:hypothetical protein
LIRGFLPAVLKNSVLILAQVSHDCRTVSAAEDFVLPRGSTLLTLFQSVTARGLLAAELESVAAALVRGGKYVGRLNAESTLEDGQIVRFDTVGVLAEGEQTMPVIPAAVGTTGWLISAGEPFRVRVREGARLADVKEDALARLPEDARKRARFLLGGEWLQFAEKAVLSDDTELTDVGRSCLYVVAVFPGPARGRKAAGPVRIDN